MSGGRSDQPMPMPPIPEPARPFGFVEWFRTGEHERVEQALDGMLGCGASHLRTQLSWAEYHQPGGREWYDWLIPRLGQRIDLMPCLHYTPPSLSRTGHSSGPPKRLRDYADFVDEVLTRYGEHFTHLELWNEPNNLLDWDWRHDHDWLLFCEMIGAAAYWAKHRGWKVVLGGPAPFDAYWLDLMGQRGVLEQVHAVGCHGFPGTWDSDIATWDGWDSVVGEARRILAGFNPEAEVWITEGGYSTWRHDEAQQADRFLEALRADADRLYWYGWQDIPTHIAVQEGLYFDPRHYHLGVTDVRGRPKLLRRLLTGGGTAAVAAAREVSAPSLAPGAKPWVVLGGAGFIGSNLADALLQDGEDVIVFDNLGRDGVETNLGWLKQRQAGRLHAVVADLRDETALRDVIEDAAGVYHLAAQVAVTTSIEDPMEDFAVNARGTLNVLEAIRRTGRPIPLVFASTNKVYGQLEDLAVQRMGERWLPVDEDTRRFGIGETRPLDFCTPYGCSKGVADQYVLDYAKTYGLPTAVLRMSCIYGPRQFGTEDQGWVAHFLLATLKGEPITIYGDGRQVRDVLHVSDAVAAYRTVMGNLNRLKGRALNLGGGPANAVSLMMVLDEIRRLTGAKPVLRSEDWRTGDQLYFAADTRRLQETVGWRAQVGWQDGLKDLAGWLETLAGPDTQDARRLTA